MIAPLLTLGVLGFGAAQPMLHGRPGDVDAYFARVRGAAEMPMQIGDWEGKDTPMQQAAFQLLKPNRYISRNYVSRKAGAAVDFLLVQCEDARDPAGHYPPNCYPGAGWTLVNQVPKAWEIAGMNITGVEYEFTMQGAATQGHIYVDDFFVMPDGSFVPDMTQFNRVSADYRKRYYGAAQVEVTFNANTLPQDRDARLGTFVGACEPLLNVIRSGCKP